MADRIVPAINAEDDDDVIVALATARVSEERGDLDDAAKWLHRAAAAARRQGRPERAGMLSRSAARVVGGNGEFEKTPDERQILSEIGEDDFSEKTIVETAAEIAQKGAPDAASSVSKNASVVTEPTPVAPLIAQNKVVLDGPVRVAVKAGLGGKWEVRPLAEGEPALAGETEALLGPVER